MCIYIYIYAYIHIYIYSIHKLNSRGLRSFSWPQEASSERVGIHQRGVQPEGGVQWMGVALYDKTAYNIM